MLDLRPPMFPNSQTRPDAAVVPTGEVACSCTHCSRTHSPHARPAPPHVPKLPGSTRRCLAHAGWQAELICLRTRHTCTQSTHNTSRGIPRRVLPAWLVCRPGWRRRRGRMAPATSHGLPAHPPPGAPTASVKRPQPAAPNPSRTASMAPARLPLARPGLLPPQPPSMPAAAGDGQGPAWTPA
jgi:hypothetical protein